MTTLSSTTPLQDAGTLGQLMRRARVLAMVLIPAMVLSTTLVITQKRSIRVADRARAAIPESIAEPGRVWSSVSMALSEREMDILETHDYVYRTYMDGVGDPVDLCVVFSGDNRKGTHPPDVCLEGGGSRIVAHFDRTVEVGPGQGMRVRELVTSYGGHMAYYCYFYKCGDSFTSSFYEQQWKIIWNGMRGRNSSGALIRYSTVMADMQSLGRARERVDGLIGATFPAIRDRLNAQ